jgi:acyl-CoA thioester hydrolase
MKDKTERPALAFRCAIDALRLGEFDLGGVLYHANYFHLYETARERLLAEHGLPYSLLVSRSCHLTVTESHQQFFAPVSYGIPLSLYLWFTRLRYASVVANYEIEPAQSPGGELLHRAWTKHVFVASTEEGFEVEPFPDELEEIFSKYAI